MIRLEHNSLLLSNISNVICDLNDKMKVMLHEQVSYRSTLQYKYCDWLSSRSLQSAVSTMDGTSQSVVTIMAFTEVQCATSQRVTVMIVECAIVRFLCARCALCAVSYTHLTLPTNREV